MKKKLGVSFIIVTLLVTLACTISYEGVSIGDDPYIEFIEDQKATAMSAIRSLQSAGTPEPEYQP